MNYRPTSDLIQNMAMGENIVFGGKNEKQAEEICLFVCVT